MDDHLFFGDKPTHRQTDTNQLTDRQTTPRRGNLTNRQTDSFGTMILRLARPCDSQITGNASAQDHVNNLPKNTVTTSSAMQKSTLLYETDREPKTPSVTLYFVSPIVSTWICFP